MKIDISVVLTVHNEGEIVSRTLASLDSAARDAEKNGLTTELVVVMDAADGQTEALIRGYESPTFDNIQRLSVVHHATAHSRNVGVQAALGEYVMILDGDDLVSYNYLSALYAAASSHGNRTVFYPQWVVGFGSNDFLTFYDNPTHAKSLMLDTNPYVSSCFFHSSVFSKVRYKDPSEKMGEAFEDWLFNADLLAEGFELKYCPETILFYRQHPRSLMDSARNSDIDFQLPNSKLFSPATYTKRFAEIFGPERGAPATSKPLGSDSLANNSLLVSMVAAAELIDGGISIQNIRDATSGDYLSKNNIIGKEYFSFAKPIAGQVFKNVLFLPKKISRTNLSLILSKIKSIQSSPGNILVFSSGASSDKKIRSHFEKDDFLLDISEAENLTAEQSAHIVYRLIQAAAEYANIFFLKNESGASIVESYKRQLSNHRIISFEIRL